MRDKAQQSEAPIQHRAPGGSSEAIEALIHAFFTERSVGAEFCLTDVIDYVRNHRPVKADTAGRTLRDMREKGKVDYTVVDRPKSLYQIEPVEEKGEA